MNIFDNKALLRSLLKQSDMINTINGGTAQTRMEITETGHGIVYSVKAPTIKPEAFNVVLNNKELVIFSVLTVGTEERSGEELINVPMFMHKCKLPADIDTDNIEAIFEDNELRVILPYYKKQHQKTRQIKIKQL